MSTNLEVRRALDGTPLMPGRNGGLLRAGGGRPPYRLRRVVKAARLENWDSLKELVRIRDTDPDPEVRIKACLGILRISGVERIRPRKAKRATISVVRASPAEQVAKVLDATARDSSGADDPPPTTP